MVSGGYRKFSAIINWLTYEYDVCVPLKAYSYCSDNDKAGTWCKENAFYQLVELLQAEYTHAHSTNQGRAFLGIFVFVIKACVTDPFSVTSIARDHIQVDNTTWEYLCKSLILNWHNYFLYFLFFCNQSLHQGVERDLERQRRKRQNQIELEEQIALTKKLTEQRDRDKQSVNHPSWYR